MSLLATLGTRRCRDNGDAERNGGLEDVEMGVRVAEVDGGLKWSPLWEIEGTLGLTAAANFVFDEINGGESHDGDVEDIFSAICWIETDATRGRWPRPDMMELGVEGPLAFDTFVFTESLLTFEVIRMDGVGLG